MLRRQTFASLSATVVQTGPAPSIPVILCHGYGATADDLVSLAEPICDYLEGDCDRFQFVFPAAPMSPPELAAYGGRAWWEINMQKLLAASQTGTFDELHDVEPPGIAEATEKLAACVDAVVAGLDEVKSLVIGGFSQGAMVTMNAALRSAIREPDLMVQFSGTVVCRPQWKAAMEKGRLKNTFVLQSHGRQDPVLPFSSAEVLRDLLEQQSVEHQFIDFRGPHTIPMEAIMQLAVKLKSLGANLTRY